jgi:hypothetical protein
MWTFPCFVPIIGRVIMNLCHPTNYFKPRLRPLPLKDTTAESGIILLDLKEKGYVTAKLHT